MDNSLLRKIMKDIRVELTEEFDLNFERKAFFDRKWTPLSPNYQPTTGSMLIRTGALRRGLRSRIDGTRLIYSNSVPYAGIHNYGGRIKQDFVPSTQMRRWAWAQYHETKNEKFRQMALAKRIKRTIVIPARPFVGDHPRVHDSGRGGEQPPAYRAGTGRYCPGTATFQFKNLKTQKLKNSK